MFLQGHHRTLLKSWRVYSTYTAIALKHLLILTVIMLHFYNTFYVFFYSLITSVFLLALTTINFYKLQLGLCDWLWCTGRHKKGQLEEYFTMSYEWFIPFCAFLCVSLCQQHSENWLFNNKGISFIWTFCTSETTE